MAIKSGTLIGQLRPCLRQRVNVNRPFVNRNSLDRKAAAEQYFCLLNRALLSRRYMTRQFRLLATSLVLLWASAAAFGHHSAANRVTEGKTIQWPGKIAFVSWDGAHVMYRIDVSDANGVIDSWQVLGGSPTRLASRGIYQKTVQAGDVVIVAGYLNLYNKIVTPVYFALADGRKLFVGYANDDAAFSAPL